MTIIDLVSARTSDGYWLHGALFPSGETSSKGLVFVHGVAWSFYRGLMFRMAERLSGEGYLCLSINTRGHDWVSRSPSRGFEGAAFEKFDDCLLDLDAFLPLLEDRGVTATGLVGHSLGALKVLYYQSRRKRPTVKAVVACSPPNISHEGRARIYPWFMDKHSEAAKLLSEDRGYELLRTPAEGDTDYLISAATFVDKYGPRNTAYAAQFIGTTDCPILLISGTVERANNDFTKELSALVPPRVCQRVELQGADHFYRGHEEEAAQHISSWLKTRL